MWNLDLVLRMHQTQAILAFDGGDLSHEEKEEYLRAFIDNVTYVSKREPSNPMNAIAFTAISCDEFICKVRSLLAWNSSLKPLRSLSVDRYLCSLPIPALDMSAGKFLLKPTECSGVPHSSWLSQGARDNSMQPGRASLWSVEDQLD